MLDRASGFGAWILAFHRVWPSRSGVRLVTGNAFDSVGASAAGMRTARVNRSDAPFDTIGAQPDLTVPALDQLPAALADVR
jgi:hypothetical protein